MPTNQNAYNSRITDESLEKRFRDTFTSQGGAELVNDLYASGVIVPVVDFTAAAEGSQLPSNLQTAWDFSTGANQVTNTTTTLITTTGFWRVDVSCVWETTTSVAFPAATIQINDGTSTKFVWGVSRINESPAVQTVSATTDNGFIVFLRSGDSLTATSNASNCTLDVWYRQIADVSGNLTNPLGFTSS